MAEVVGPRLSSCCNCRNHVALHDLSIHRSIVLQGRHRRAFLFSHAMNIMVGPEEDRQLMTGLHTVAAVECLVGNMKELMRKLKNTRKGSSSLRS
ncbi:hypothetical protein NC651_009038 [Populus alba x Populus x berolinensis]|nr:hypothetical protein NC651_009038 [Populus alba x Populus x berolinensis]